MTNFAQQLKAVRTELKKTLGGGNVMAVPTITKVVISVGTGRLRDKKQQALVAERLARITGQKASPRLAKKSIASFKLRQGEPIGQVVTLRGRRMYDFLGRFINASVPRMRDFRGFEEKSLSATGILTLGLREHTIFPETADEELKDVFGLAITIVTNATSRTDALVLLQALHFPFKKSTNSAPAVA